MLVGLDDENNIQNRGKMDLLREKLRGKLKDEKGLTLIEMLIAILIFILATVFIISLVSNALDKPKVAGIKGALDYYETGASLLLHETVSVPDKATLLSELNNDLDEEAKFKGGKSGLVNAYNNPYKAKVVQTESQTAVVVETKGNKVDELYKVVVIKDKGTVESCTVGFGRNDKGLVTLVSDLCGDQQVIGDVVSEPIEDLAKGTVIKFGDKEWTLLDPATGYIHLNVGQGLGAGMKFNTFLNNKYDPGDVNSIGYYLNTTWFSGLTVEDKGLVVERDWGIALVTREEGALANELPTLSIGDMRNKENNVVVSAKVGLLSVSEYLDYSKYHNVDGGLVESGVGERTWLRTPSTSVEVWFVTEEGWMNFLHGSYTAPNLSIRPALNIKSGTTVAPDGTLLP